MIDDEHAPVRMPAPPVPHAAPVEPSKPFAHATVPILINCRDRVEDLSRLVMWLEDAGHENIVLLDNDSTYPPLLNYYRSTPHTVMRLGGNFGKMAPWNAGPLVPDEYFVYTDPDILPIEECPKDAVDHLYEILQQHPFPKAGLGMYMKDVPKTLQSYAWELGPQINGRELRQGVRESLVDTTFALYRPKCAFGLRALRTDFPYQCRHAPWYRMSEPTEEESYYLRNCIKGPQGSSWAAGEQ